MLGVDGFGAVEPCATFCRRLKDPLPGAGQIAVLHGKGPAESLAGCDGNSAVQEPTKACTGALHALEKVVARIQMEHRVDPPAMVISAYLLGVRLNRAQDRILGFALLISQREIYAVRLVLWLMGEDVLLHSGKPKGAGHTAHPGKQICLVDGVQSKQPGQRVPGDAPPTRNAAKLFLCRRNDLLGQKPQIVVRPAGAGVRIFESRWTIPGGHIVVPVQIADGHQRERRAASSLRGLIYLLPFAGEGVEVDNRGICFQTRENGYRFLVYREGVHSAHHPLSTITKVIVLLFGQNYVKLILPQ